MYRMPMESCSCSRLPDPKPMAHAPRLSARKTRLEQFRSYAVHRRVSSRCHSATESNRTMNEPNPINKSALDLLFVDILMLGLKFTSERPSVVEETEAFTFWRHLETGQRSLVVLSFADRTVTRYDQDATNYPTTKIDKPSDAQLEQKRSPLMNWLLSDEPAPFFAAVVDGEIIDEISPRWKCGHCRLPLISCTCTRPQWIEERETPE